MSDTKKTIGRPELPPDEKLERLTLFVPKSVIDKVDRYGKAWAREVLKRAKPPKD